MTAIFAVFIFLGHLNVMENQTISQLNDRVWYRTLKVLYAVLFVITLVCLNTLAWTNTRITTPTEKIVTQDQFKQMMAKIPNGDPKTLITTLHEQGYKLVGLDTVTITKDQFTQAFAKMPSGTSAIDFAASLKRQGYMPDTSENTSRSAVIYFIVGNLAIILFFEFLRRAFYYIVLGKLSPKK